MNVPQLPTNPHGADEAAPMMQTGPPTAPGPQQTTTKPRQMPGGGGGGGFDPATNGGNLQQGTDAGQPGTPESDAPAQTPSAEAAPKVAVIADEIVSANPGMPPRVAFRVAERVYADYLSKEAAWPSNPLSYVDWTDVEDGAITKGIGRGRPGRPERPSGKGEPREPGTPGEPEPRTHDEPKDYDPEQDDSEWYHTHGEYESESEWDEPKEPVDLSEWDQVKQTRMQRLKEQAGPLKEKAGPMTRRLIREHGPEVARALWQMRKMR